MMPPSPGRHAFVGLYWMRGFGYRAATPAAEPTGNSAPRSPRCCHALLAASGEQLVRASVATLSAAVRSADIRGTSLPSDGHAACDAAPLAPPSGTLHRVPACLDALLSFIRG